VYREKEEGDVMKVGKSCSLVIRKGEKKRFNGVTMVKSFGRVLMR
jgi:hypothetical protein